MIEGFRALARGFKAAADKDLGNGDLLRSIAAGYDIAADDLAAQHKALVDKVTDPHRSDVK